MNHGRPGASRGTGSGAIVARRLMAGARGGLRGRVWVGHRHPEAGSQPPRPASPEPTADVPTRSTYRSLIIRGLEPDEAANLTAWLAGIAVGESHWTLRQINQLLFLREMNRSGHFTEASERLH